MSLGACAPRPFAKTTPFMVSGWPSPAGFSPLLVSFSTGPQPLTACSQVRSLMYEVPAPGGAGGTTAYAVNVAETVWPLTETCRYESVAVRLYRPGGVPSGGATVHVVASA